MGESQIGESVSTPPSGPSLPLVRALCETRYGYELFPSLNEQAPVLVTNEGTRDRTGGETLGVRQILLYHLCFCPYMFVTTINRSLRAESDAKGRLNAH